MALNKVEICGVNTSRLPVLTNEEKEALFERIKKEIPKPGNDISKGICVWYSVSLNDFPAAMKMQMTCFRLDV